MTSRSLIRCQRHLELRFFSLPNCRRIINLQNRGTVRFNRPDPLIVLNCRPHCVMQPHRELLGCLRRGVALDLHLDDVFPLPQASNLNVSRSLLSKSEPASADASSVEYETMTSRSLIGASVTSELRSFSLPNCRRIGPIFRTGGRSASIVPTPSSSSIVAPYRGKQPHRELLGCLRRGVALDLHLDGRVP